MYKVLSADLHCPIFSLICNTTQQPTSSIILTSSPPINPSSIKKTLCPPPESLLYPVVSKEVEQQFSGRGVRYNKRNLHSCFSEHKQLRKSSCAASHLLLSSVAGAVPNSGCHWVQQCLCRLLIIHSPQGSLPSFVAERRARKETGCVLMR
jgi:hypothetical protein